MIDGAEEEGQEKVHIREQNPICGLRLLLKDDVFQCQVFPPPRRMTQRHDSESIHESICESLGFLSDISMAAEVGALVKAVCDAVQNLNAIQVTSALGLAPETVASMGQRPESQEVQECVLTRPGKLLQG